MVMEFLEGTTLDKRIRSRGRLFFLAPWGDAMIAGVIARCDSGERTTGVASRAPSLLTPRT